MGEKNYPITATIEKEIDSAHFLPDYPGKCKDLHGHRWKIQVEIKGEISQETGMLVDFKVVKDTIDSLDHKNINDFLENPTAENIAYYLYQEISRVLGNLKQKSFISRLSVWESKDCCVTIE